MPPNSNSKWLSDRLTCSLLKYIFFLHFKITWVMKYIIFQEVYHHLFQSFTHCFDTYFYISFKIIQLKFKMADCRAILLIYFPVWGLCQLMALSWNLLLQSYVIKVMVQGVNKIAQTNSLTVYSRHQFAVYIMMLTMHTIAI